MPINKPINLEEIRKTINVSSSKNNNLLIFFTIFMLYILISVLGTSDLMLLLPQKSFKMPIINFELDLIAFYILAPVMLLLLHFNNLFNYNMYLRKIDKHSKQINMESLNPSIYGYAYSLHNKGFGGFLLNLFLWFWIYLIPPSILMLIFIRFADYHHVWITFFHFFILIVDIFLILLSLYYNKIHIKNEQNSVLFLRWVIYFIVIGMTGIFATLFLYFFFVPVIDTYNKNIQTDIKKSPVKQFICKVTTKMPNVFLGNISPDAENNDDFSNCFPRLVVNEAEMAKISKTALYIPRYLAMGETTKDKEDKEKELILKYGTRIDLTYRNLRYADLEKCILTRADMRHTKLEAANLKGSHMQAIDLSYANLQDANLQEVKLQAARLKGANLQGATLVRANIPNVYFPDNNLNNSHLQRAQLKQAVFQKLDLQNVDFRNADLSMTNFIDANLTGDSLHDANITSASFDKADLTAADLSGIIFVKGDWTTPSFKETKMFGVNISKSKLQDINLTACQKQFTFDINVSDEYLTFYGRRVKYLNTIIHKINAKEPMTHCKSQNEILASIDKLQDILKTSCKHLKDEAFKYRIRKDIEKIYNELITICKY